MRTIIPKNAKLVPEDAELVFKGQIFDVYHWQQEMFDGSVATFEMLKRPDTLKVIAVKDDKIILLDEEQPPHKPFVDLPGGRHDVSSETELEAAKRELLEETGMSFKDWRLIKVTQPHSKIEWFVYLFLATGFLAKTDPKLDAGEKIKVNLVNFKEFSDMLRGPESRYLPADILGACQSLDDLLNLPEYKA